MGSLTTKKKDLDNILDTYLAIRPRQLETRSLSSSFKNIADDNAHEESYLRHLLCLIMSTELYEPPLPCKLNKLDICRLDSKTMFAIRKWERFQFGIDYEHQQVFLCFSRKIFILVDEICSVLWAFSTRKYLKDPSQMLWSRPLQERLKTISFRRHDSIFFSLRFLAFFNQ